MFNQVNGKYQVKCDGLGCDVVNYTGQRSFAKRAMYRARKIGSTGDCQAAAGSTSVRGAQRKPIVTVIMLGSTFSKSERSMSEPFGRAGPAIAARVFARRTCQAIEPRDHDEHVAGVELGERATELGAISLRPCSSSLGLLNPAG